MQEAAEPGEMLARPLPVAVRTVAVERRGRTLPDQLRGSAA